MIREDRGTEKDDGVKCKDCRGTWRGAGELKKDEMVKCRHYRCKWRGEWEI